MSASLDNVLAKILLAGALATVIFFCTYAVTQGGPGSLVLDGLLVIFSWPIVTIFYVIGLLLIGKFAHYMKRAFYPVGIILGMGMSWLGYIFATMVVGIHMELLPFIAAGFVAGLIACVQTTANNHFNKGLGSRRAH